MDVDISPPGLKPDPFATVGFKEAIDKKNTFSSRILEGNKGDNFGNDAGQRLTLFLITSMFM